MSEDERTLIERRLLRERERSRAALGRYGAEARTFLAGEASGTPRSPSHMADQATDMMERELTLFFASKEGRHLQEVESALRRLYQAPASFGLCAGCGAAIPFSRLDAVPYTTSCLDCQRSSEVSSVAA